MSSRTISGDEPNNRSPGGLQVIGAGLMRTGTNSQMKALEILLGGRCYHMEYIMGKNRKHLELWYRAACDGLTKELADEIFAGFRSCTDFPAANFYQELAELYPSAKIVLSVRDPKRWVESVRATIMQTNLAAERMLPPVRWLLGISFFLPLHDQIMVSRFGISFRTSDAEMIRAFERHTEAVIQAIPKDRLLVFKVADGWEPLCNFLELPVPDEPFPNVNDTKQFQRVVRFLNGVAVVGNLVFCSAVGAVAWFGVKYALNKMA